MRTIQTGDQLDHYLVDELLAQGSAASIFRGTDLRTAQPVAIKVPHPEVEGDVLFYERLLREQKIGQTLDHPAIVKTFHNDRHSRVYIVMEFVHGKLLRHLLSEQGRLPVERAVGIAAAICEALEYIHSQGVVHRDLKPENIIVDDNDRIKLIDFGIASLAGARRLTFGKLSQVMGTPDYISPEQVAGKRGNQCSDIYALGVILYEMLMGETPFAAENPFVTMKNRLVNNPVPLRELDPGITPELQQVVSRALERNPVNRYSNARHLLNDLLHPDRVKVTDGSEPRDCPRQPMAWKRAELLYGTLAMIPLGVMALLLFVAGHG
jgi:serine/threonine protein kinase